MSFSWCWCLCQMSAFESVSFVSRCSSEGLHKYNRRNVLTQRTSFLMISWADPGELPPPVSCFGTPLATRGDKAALTVAPYVSSQGSCIFITCLSMDQTSVKFSQLIPDWRVDRYNLRFIKYLKIEYPGSFLPCWAMFCSIKSVFFSFLLFFYKVLPQVPLL